MRFIEILIIVSIICLTLLLCFNSTYKIRFETDKDFVLQAQEINIKQGNDSFNICNIAIQYSKNTGTVKLYSQECNK